MSIPLFQDSVNAGFVFSVLMFGIASLLLLALYLCQWKSDGLSFLVWLLGYTVAGLLTLWLTDNSLGVLLTLGMHFLLVALFLKLSPIISLFGVFFLISLFTPSLYGLVWGIELIYTVGHSLNAMLFTLLMLAAIFLTFIIIINTVQLSWSFLARYSALYFRFPRTHAAWEQADKAEAHPWVSLHVPCYSEPPAIVIETLDALARLEYPNFEVIVIDNNTQDPNLWKPLQEHCAKLGEHFRFFHFDHLKGAKAGALNTALKLTTPKAEIVGIIDADFVTQPDFLKKLVGFFQDAKVGFVQTCQDYRAWRTSNYLSSCYFEYENHFKLVMPGQNEWDANYTIGTMCLFRKKSLEEAGGWAEWCLTEDSEIAVRIHALGYTGFYLKNSFGYGLIPETFESYKQQRFRWAAGPSQQFQRYWRLYLSLRPSGLTFVQKMNETFHSLSVFFNELLTWFLNIPLLIICLWFVIKKQQSFYLPPILLLFVGINIVRNMICNWIKIKLLGGDWRDGIFSSIAVRSLNYTKNSAFIKAWTSKDLTWKRTEKFEVNHHIWRIFSSARAEIIAGTIYLFLAIIIGQFVSFRHPDMLFLLWLAILNQCLSYMCAPLMAFLSEKDLKLKKRSK